MERTRFTVIGPGGVGGVIAARLALSGADVVVVGRGAHADAVRHNGLELREPSGTQHVRLELVSQARSGDTIILAVKSPDTVAALALVPPGSTVICAQNGIDNEALVAERHQALGMCVWMQAVHLEPGVVSNHSVSPAGVLDVGPVAGAASSGPDDLAAMQAATNIAAALMRAGFESRVNADIMSMKRAKLVSNLPGVMRAAGRDPSEHVADMRALVAEGHAVFGALGKSVMPLDELAARCACVTSAEVAGQMRPGGSLWQSVQRGSALELRSLNGTICRLGRDVGVPTPINDRYVELVSVRASEPSR